MLSLLFTPVTFSFFSTLSTRGSTRRSIFLEFLETSSFGRGSRNTISFSFQSDLEFFFRFVMFRFVSFIKNPQTSFWWRSFFAYDSLIRTVNMFDIYIYICVHTYIYIYLVFFSLFFIERAECCSARGRHTHTHETCIFVFLPHPCVFLSGTRETLEREQHHTWLIFVIKADAQGGGHERKRKRHGHCRFLLFSSSQRKA